MTDVDLSKKPTATLQDTIAELKFLVGVDDFDGAWKSVHQVYNYDRGNTTLTELDRMKTSLKARRKKAVFNIVRYIFLFWKRMLKAGQNMVVTAQQYTEGFDLVESEDQMIQTLVRTSDHPAFPYNWENAIWRVVNKKIYSKPGYGNLDILTCHVECWVRDHEEEWDFSIPVKFLDPDYDFEADEKFMDDLDQVRYDSVYHHLFDIVDMDERRAIIKLLPKELIESIVNITGRKMPSLEDLSGR